MSSRGLKTHTSEQRRRFLEILGMVLITGILVAISRLEHRLFTLSEDLAQNAEFFTTIVYFGLVNLNVVLVLLLGFLIFRNVARLVVERRRGVLGAKLRTKLIVTLVFFALAPTLLIFYMSSQFLTTSFDTWFSAKVRDTIKQTRELGTQVYRQDQRRLESLARIALQRLKVTEIQGLAPKIDTRGLRGFETDYGLYAIRVIAFDGQLIWSFPKRDATEEVLTPAVRGALERFANEPALLSTGAVEADENSDLVKGFAPITSLSSGQLLGMIITEEHFETQILKSLETILNEFASLRPRAQLTRLSSMTSLVMMVFLIGFATTWLGFYVARSIVNPIQSLSEAMLEVAGGNYDVPLPQRTDDETGTLVRAFETMLVDLRAHEARNKDVTSKLQTSNDELQRRQQYLEILLRNMTAGVISTDAQFMITSLNDAAERLLGVKANDVVGQRIDGALGAELCSLFWRPIHEKIEVAGTFNDQIVIEGRNLTLLTAGTKIFDNHGRDLGVVLVFDDATEQVRAQRVAAWREVARRIAHEIKNPITPIKLSAERLLRRYERQFAGDDREVFTACIATILSQVDALRDLVNEFSKFSRLPSIKTEPTDVAMFLKDSVTFFKMSYSDIHFDLEDIADSLPSVRIDKEQFGRALMNVVANSVAALEAVVEKRISIRARVVETLNVVRVEIADNGCGIPSKDKDKAFEPYFSTKKDGTGLGLAIVNQIISDHGGYVRIVDNEPQGTKVIFELPLGPVVT